MKKHSIARLLLIAGLAVFTISAVPSEQTEKEQLIKSAYLGETGKVQALLDQGAEVNLQTNNGKTAPQRGENQTDRATAPGGGGQVIVRSKTLL